MFRDAVVNKADNYAQKSLKDAAAVIDANLKKEKKDMITGKLPNEKAVELMLDKYAAKQADVLRT